MSILASCKVFDPAYELPKATYSEAIESLRQRYDESDRSFPFEVEYHRSKGVAQWGGVHDCYAHTFWWVDGKAA